MCLPENIVTYSFYKAVSYTHLVAGAEYSPGGDDPDAEPPDLTQEEEMRGVWIASVYNIDFPKAIGDAEAQKRELIDILETTAAAGLNTVFFQVRPQGDALYPVSYTHLDVYKRQGNMIIKWIYAR